MVTSNVSGITTSQGHVETSFTSTCAVPSQPLITAQTKRFDSAATLEFPSPFTVHVVSKENQQIRCVAGKRYIGLAKDFPPPPVMNTEWIEDVRPMLNKDISSAISQRHSSLSREKQAFQAWLRYSGDMCHAKKIPTEYQKPELPDEVVILAPAIWIDCNSKEVYQTITRHLPGLRYLEDFRRKYRISQKTCVWRLKGENKMRVWMNSEAERFGKISPTEGSQRVFLDIGVDTETTRNMHRIRSKFSVWDGSDISTRESIVGGFIRVDENIYGLTTAHALVQSLDGEQDSDSDGSSTDDEIVEVSDDSDINSLFSHLILDRENINYVEYHLGNDTDTPAKADDKHITSQSQLKEMTAYPPKILAYGNRGTTRAKYDALEDNAPSGSDFALIDSQNFGPHRTSYNSYYCPDKQVTWKISDIAHERNVDKDLWILENPARPIKAHLLPDPHSVSVGDSTVNMRVLQPETPGYPGMSGAWVVRRHLLYGIIYGGYGNVPYMFMLPIKTIFDNIKKFTSSQTVKIAVDDDWNNFGDPDYSEGASSALKMRQVMEYPPFESLPTAQPTAHFASTDSPGSALLPSLPQYGFNPSYSPQPHYGYTPQPQYGYTPQPQRSQISRYQQLGYGQQSLHGQQPQYSQQSQYGSKDEYYTVQQGLGSLPYSHERNDSGHGRFDSVTSQDTSGTSTQGMPDPLDPTTRAQLPDLIEGTPSRGWYESLDSSYRMRTGPEARDFFRVGRVFSLLYSEAASETLARGGSDNDAITVIRFGQSSYSQVRRFVVVSVKHGFVYACAISTYSHRGVLKPGCYPQEHTIVYAQGSNPTAIQGEFDAGMTKDPIEIIPADSSVTIDPCSRLRFGKTYPIEWNVKVKNIGQVHPEFLSKLILYWKESDA